MSFKLIITIKTMFYIFSRDSEKSDLFSVEICTHSIKAGRLSLKIHK